MVGGGEQEILFEKLKICIKKKFVADLFQSVREEVKTILFCSLFHCYY